MTERTFHYWLPTSAITFAGTVTTETFQPAEDARTTYEATALLGVRADRTQSAPWLVIDDETFAKKKATLSLSEDGRLTGTALTSTGQGSTVLAAVATLVGAGVGLATAPYKTLGAGPPTKAELLLQLGRREDELAMHLAELPIADATPEVKLRLELIERSLTAIAEQRNRLALEQVAAAAARSTATVTHSYTLDVQQLPTEAQLRAGLPEGSPEWRIWNDLRIMAVVPDYVRDHDPRSEYGEGGDASIQADASGSIWYRLPRPVEIRVFRLDDRHQPELVRVTTEEVVDKFSRHIGLALTEDGWFRDSELTVVFGSLGTPTTITTASDSGLADALTALAGAPKAVTTGHAAAAGLLAALAPPDPETEQLNRLKVLKERMQLSADILKLQQPPTAVTSTPREEKATG